MWVLATSIVLYECWSRVRTFTRHLSTTYSVLIYCATVYLMSGCKVENSSVNYDSQNAHYWKMIATADNQTTGSGLQHSLQMWKVPRTKPTLHINFFPIFLLQRALIRMNFSHLGRHDHFLWVCDQGKASANIHVLTEILFAPPKSPPSRIKVQRFRLRPH